MSDHLRRGSHRLQAYDYAQAGAYFVTLCLHGRQCLLGEIEDGTFEPNIAGLMVESWWGGVSGKFPDVMLDAYVVMPNHFHGIVLLGAGVDESEPIRLAAPGGHAGPPLPASERSLSAGPDASVGAVQCDRPAPRMEPVRNPTLGRVVQWFKTMTTNDYMRGVRTGDLPAFERRLWQRDYYDHIIRNEAALEKIRAYIAGNPANWAEDTENPERIRAPVSAPRALVC